MADGIEAFSGKVGSAIRLFQRRPVAGILCWTLFISAVFILFPGLDLAVSRLFYTPGKGFPVSASPFWQDVRALGFTSYRVVLFAGLLSLAAYGFTGLRRFLLAPRAALLIVSVSLLAPGLLVNMILKDLWGRARPVAITDFGGDRLFSRAWQISDQCSTNCSFVSGEASTAIFMLVLALIVPLGWRRVTTLLALVFAVVISGARIAFGGHFLSDVLISWGLTLAILIACHRAIMNGPSDETIADWLQRQGQRIRRFFTP